MSLKKTTTRASGEEVISSPDIEEQLGQEATSDLNDFGEAEGYIPPTGDNTPDSSRATTPVQMTGLPNTTTSNVVGMVASAVKQSMAAGLVVQKPLFVIDTRQITAEQALKFQNQANQWAGNFTVHQVIVAPAIYVMGYALASDSEFTLIPVERIPNWSDYLTVKQTAQYITKYFGDKHDIGRTLAENFSKIDLVFNYTNVDVERKSYMQLKELTTIYEQDNVITSEQHSALIITIEKKLPADSQIKMDYFAMKREFPAVNETWEQAFIRLGKCVDNVRKLIKKIAHYGDTSQNLTLRLRTADVQGTVSRPALQTPAPRQVSTSSAPIVSRPIVPQPTKSAGLQKRSATEGPVTLRPPGPCRSCGHKDHELKLCPFLFYSDANNDLHLEWDKSPMGKSWAEYGLSQYDDTVQLPGCEDRYLKKLPSEFVDSMTKPPSNDFKRTRFEEGQPRPKPGLSNEQFAKNRRRKQGNTNTLANQLASTISNIDVDTNFLPVLIFINQQKKGTLPVLTSLKNVPKTSISTKALLDTGSLRGDLISHTLVNKL